ncbi:MAG: hypothetical protein US76_02060 [Parcubacteria group bacterium GW2011_GWA2_38_13b]|nr:MAG: hypothetical protein US76_02060 [Parcubacteria group bacterium GW2011_GWA2_38_13b]
MSVTKICKAGEKFEKVIGLAVLYGIMGIAFYPLPAGSVVFYTNGKLRNNGFFVMEDISNGIFNKVMAIRAEKVQDLSCENLYKMSDILDTNPELLGE